MSDSKKLSESGDLSNTLRVTGFKPVRCPECGGVIQMIDACGGSRKNWYRGELIDMPIPPETYTPGCARCGERLYGPQDSEVADVASLAFYRGRKLGREEALGAVPDGVKHVPAHGPEETGLMTVEEIDAEYLRLTESMQNEITRLCNIIRTGGSEYVAERARLGVSGAFDLDFPKKKE